MRAIGGVRFRHVRRFAAEAAERRIPTQLFTADDDRLVEPSIGVALGAELGELERFETGGHNIQKTRAVEIAQTLAASF